jgi:transcriptional regulator with XRE-family HTH domain
LLLIAAKFNIFNVLKEGEDLTKESYRIIFSKNLCYYLEIKGKHQTDLIKDLGISSSTVSNWCTGQKLPRMSKIQMLADYLGIMKSDLIEDKDNRMNAYYFDKEASEAAQFLYDNPEYKVLFEEFRKVRPEDIGFVKDLIKRLTKQ